MPRKSKSKSKQKLSKNQLEFNRQIKRIRSGFYRYKKQGFILDIDINSLIEKPKKITKKFLEKISNIKPKELKKYATQFDVETGEIISTPTTNKPLIKPSKPAPKRSQPQTITQETIVSYPSLSIFDAIIDKIQGLPDKAVARRDIYLSSRRNALVDILEDTMNVLDDEELDAFAYYLESKQQEIFDELGVITYASSEDKVDASFARLGMIFNNGELSATQAESLNSMQEMYYSM